MLPTHAFHVVFTLPRQLRHLALVNPVLVFDTLFACATASLLEMGRDPRRLGAELGITSVLHTWTRELRYHPHVHCIVTGGGLSPDAQQWIAAPTHYLFAVRALGKLFRGKLLDALQCAHRKGELCFDGPAVRYADPERFRRLIDKLYRTRWVVYCKPPFGNQEQVFRYLGHYTHRVGISNERLVALDHRGVTFRTRGDSKVTLSPDEFLRRFVMHVLPKGFVKIRHHGLFAATNVSSKLERARALVLCTDSPTTPSATSMTKNSSGVPRDFREVLLALTGLDLRQCSQCGALALVRCPLELLAEHSSRTPPTSSYPPLDSS